MVIPWRTDSKRMEQFNHLAMVAEGAACFQWVCIEPTPAPFLSDVIPGSEMYANKVWLLCGSWVRLIGHLKYRWEDNTAHRHWRTRLRGVNNIHAQFKSRVVGGVVSTHVHQRVCTLFSLSYRQHAQGQPYWYRSLTQGGACYDQSPLES